MDGTWCGWPATGIASLPGRWNAAPLLLLLLLALLHLLQPGQHAGAVDEAPGLAPLAALLLLLPLCLQRWLLLLLVMLLLRRHACHRRGLQQLRDELQGLQARQLFQCRACEAAAQGGEIILIGVHGIFFIL